MLNRVEVYAGGDAKLSIPMDEYIEDAALEAEEFRKPKYVVVPKIPDELYTLLTKALTVEDMATIYKNFHKLEALTVASIKVMVQEFFLRVIDDPEVFMPSGIVLWSLDIHNVTDYVNKPEIAAAVEECSLKDTNYYSVLYGAIGGERVANSKYEEYIFLLDAGTRVIETDKECMTIKFVNEVDKSRLGKVIGAKSNIEQIEYRLRPNEQVNVKEYISYVNKEDSGSNYKTLLKGFFKAMEVDCWSYQKGGYYSKVIGVKFMDEQKKH